MPINRRIPIKEVAVAAGVSTQTVSRVTNNRPDVSPETRQRVLDVIARLGYRPSRAARALRGASQTIGVVGFGLEFYGPSRTIVGVNQQAKQSDYSLVLELVSDPENLDVSQILERLFANHVEGIVWCIPHIGENMQAIQEYAHGNDIPIVFTDIAPDMAVSMIEIDNFTGGRMATEHLIAQGHRNVALITGPTSYFSARERVRGWRAAMQEHGLSTNASLVAEGDWTAASGDAALRQILGSRADVSAIFAGNDQMALGAMRAATQRGLRIPHDLAIVGYDDIPEAAYFTPALSSVHQNVIELGASAVSEVIRLIHLKRMTGRSEPNLKMLQPELIVRESSVVSR